MLKALRANRGLPRAIALLLLFAFSAGLLHFHGGAAIGGETGNVIASHDIHDGHDHGGAPSPSVTAHCAFCAVVAGKYFLPADIGGRVPELSGRVQFVVVVASLDSTLQSDLFRPPIMLMS